jgi:hypothetical protein
VVLTKVVIEVVADRDVLRQKQAQLRGEVNDGSSLLFDLLPSYVSFNLGSSGFASKSKVADCRMLKKQGVNIDGTEHIVTLLRHSHDPYRFIIVAINL